MAEGFALAMDGRFDLNILGATFTDGSGVELARRIRAFDPLPRSIFIRPKLSWRRLGGRWEQCEQNDVVLFATLVKRRIKVLNNQIEEDQDREKGNNDSFTQGRVNERATDAETKTLAR